MIKIAAAIFIINFQFTFFNLQFVSAAEPGSYNCKGGVNSKLTCYLSERANYTEYNLNLDSAQDLLNVSQTVNEVVDEVINDLTPTDLFNTGTNFPLNLPLNPLNHIKGFGISGLDTDTTDLDLTRFFSPAGVSSGDLMSILKGVAVLSIQIFIVVVQVVWQIVQGLQGAVNS